jgi:hypothetical protein
LLVPLDRVKSNRLLAAGGALFPAALSAAPPRRRVGGRRLGEPAAAFLVRPDFGQLCPWRSRRHARHQSLGTARSPNGGSTSRAGGSCIFSACSCGLILGRTQFFAAPERFARLRWWAFGVALALGAALSLGGGAIVNAAGFGADQEMQKSAFQDLLNAYRDMAWTTVSALIVIALWRNRARPLLRLFVPAGRMTLTFYVGQSLLFVPFFYGFGLRLHTNDRPGKGLAARHCHFRRPTPPGRLVNPPSSLRAARMGLARADLYDDANTVSGASAEG